ncbi:DUF1772 domain-containing protein [Actinoplanes sp. NPDC051494]|uniref:DUF1772 domain-containing protein n=1 Tax=Actinoplanes sp. NPDC051494 TaxID=3363907 RepID=UPI0037AC9813
MDALRTSALLAATITTGLMAGLFYAYSISVMPALRGAADAVFVEVMQRINRAIVNGWFLLCFLGALLIGLAATILIAAGGDRRVLVPAVAGLFLYAVQVAITAGVSVPLNNALDAAGQPDPVAVRTAFEGRWVRWNTARTWLCAASFTSWTISCCFN